MSEHAGPRPPEGPVINRRSFLKAAAGGTVGAALSGAALLGLDGRLRHKAELAWARVEPPDLSLPASGARLATGTFQSRCMNGTVAYTYSLPPGGVPRAIVISLYGKGGDHRAAFDDLHLPDAAAHVGAPLCIASADGGPDNYWHKRANGTDAHAMVVEELVPLLTAKLGALPLTLHGYSMGGYGALLAAERGASAGGGNLFRAVAASSPALWTKPGATAPGAFDSEKDFYDNDIFTSVPALRSLKVRLDCGTLDPFFGATRQLSDMMTWPHVALFRSWAAHTSGYWRSVAPAQMHFLAQSCGVLSTG